MVYNGGGGLVGAGVPGTLDLDGRLAGADSENDDPQEIAKIVPAAIVGDGVDGDSRHEERHDPGDREDEAVPEAEKEARRLRLDGGGALGRGAAGEQQDGAGRTKSGERGRVTQRARM